ncbi:hypothetical protein [Kineococcus sp. SYSU DK003]|uniref:hypothetical protein n=1 Tax=Kineococcus sp. SYSU DK003 TaxID=3383124 RepID=UPI003D7DE827
MALYEMTAQRDLVDIPASTFAAEGIRERDDLQRALRENITVLGEDLLVVAEEFGDFDVRRRIDLLAVDRTARLVVIELKRTEDGGHMQLQALRYAAMVSAMTFEQLVATYTRHLSSTDPEGAESAREQLADWLDEVGGEDAVLHRQVRIVLAAAGFDAQITTTVLWLNDVYGLDISCVRIVPYAVAGKLLLDVQQVIPLPEAEELTVRLRQRESAARAVTAQSGRDWTQYVIHTPDGSSAPLRKRRAILELLTALHRAGVAPTDLAQALPGNTKFLSVEGELVDQELIDTFLAAHPGARRAVHRWFFDAPLHHTGRTWVLSKMWGIETPPGPGQPAAAGARRRRVPLRSSPVASAIGTSPCMGTHRCAHRQEAAEADRDAGARSGAHAAGCAHRTHERQVGQGSAGAA